MANALNSALLNMERVPKIVGIEQEKRLIKLHKWQVNTSIPLYLVGDSGTGKTALGQRLCVMWARKYKVPAYYFPLSEEDTKTSVIMGLRLDNGSLIPVDGVLAQAAVENAIVFIDEITHSTSNMLLMLNAFDGKETTISIGDRTIRADNMRILYGSNRSTHAGNIRVPPSFLNRVRTIGFDYPTFEDEVEISKQVIAKNYEGTHQYAVPHSVLRYTVSLIHELRQVLVDLYKNDGASVYPLSVRNISKILIGLQTELDGANYHTSKISTYFTNDSNIESTRRRIAERILGKAITSTEFMASQDLIDFIHFISYIGVEEFRSICLEALGYWADADGMEMGIEAFRQKMYGLLL